MTFQEVLAQVIDWLQRERRVSYRALKRQFDLDDDYLEDLKDAILFAHPVADEDGRGLVWTGDTAREPTTTIGRPDQPTADRDRDPASYTPKYLAEKILTSRTALEGERKQVTVMFCDIKDSTELIRDLDPEAAQQLLDPAIHIMMEAVHRFEGTVNQVLGDGIMALFGAPVAHEDHAARACYAALAMQAAMRPYADTVLHSHGITMQIRVGLNAGEVVVRTIGNDLHMDYSAVGPTTHLAARMEQIAMPGSVMLSGSTLRLVEGLVRVNARGPVPVKGMPEPIEVYELTGASTIRRRLQAAVARGLTRFVGRDTEIEALRQALEQAEARHGQVVAAVGEAGVGKSRLFYEFIHSHRTQGWLVLESASVSYGKATPYFPVVDLLKRYAHVEDGDDSRIIQAKVTGQILTLDEALQETIPALLSLLDALPNDSPFAQIDPPQRRQRTLDGLKRILLRESQVQPLLLVFEDLHWIDSETQALLDSLVESLPTAQLLLLVNYRPEYQHGWSSKTFYTQLRLDPLPAESAEMFLAVLLGDDPSLVPLKKLLIERTEGNPFFLEESVQTLVETQQLGGKPGMYHLAQDLLTIQVPATVQAILAARIDRLPQEEKQLLQTAAVIGNAMPFSLLQAITDVPEDILRRGLTHLQAAEFLYETSLYPEHVYTFKHALTHEVAYSSLLQEQRRALHAQIVAALETLAGDRVTDQVERLAYHAVCGEVWDKAVTYCRHAGDKAMTRSAAREAARDFEQALMATQRLPERRDLREQAIDLRLELRHAYVLLGEFERVFDYLCDAERLAQALDDAQRLGRISLFMTQYFEVTGAYDQALAAGQRALALGAARKDVGTQVGSHFYLGLVACLQGNYRHGIETLQQGIALLQGDDLYERFGLGVFPAVGCCDALTRGLAEVGDFGSGMTVGKEGLRIAEILKHPTSLVLAHMGLGTLYLRKGELDRAVLTLERAMEICQEVGISFHIPLIAIRLGSAYILSGRVDDALRLLKQAEALTTSMGRMCDRSLAATTLGEAYLRADHLTTAHAHAGQALELAQTYKERGNQAYALRLLGNIAMHRNRPEIDEAETHYQQALALANELGMLPLQAHCHRSLGTLYHQTGQSEQARVELSTAIEMYRDREMTFWLPETETALAELESR